MPASDISRLSIAGHPKSGLASKMAKDVADREIRYRIENRILKIEDHAAITREWKDLYKQEYYKYYAILLQQDQPLERVIYVPTENPAAKKFYMKHAVAGFNKSNLLIIVRAAHITVGRFNFPLDDDKSIETKEAFLGAWPGPLDRIDQDIKRRTSNYIDTLQQHNEQRKIKYCSSSGDEQRKIILKLLTELLHRNGSLDASGITRLLLKPELTEIQKDEGNTKPSETLQKYLLLGKRSEAIKYAKTRKLWDHAQCLAFLDKYQPPNTGKYIKDGLKLKDDPIVQLNNEYISSIDSEILQTVYKSLLHRILLSDPESMNIVKHPEVDNDAYRFAILSANDCEMSFDQSNEIFKLVNAIKKASDSNSMSSSHLISLGFTTLEYDREPLDDLSYRSHISFNKNDTFASRTLTISNIDMLILNEIWEYCLNLARGTTSPETYNYIINLVPFKLVFAATLLDVGLYQMFPYYLMSIKNALSRPYPERDQFYDWDTINRSVEHLTHVWNIFSRSTDTMNPDMHNFESTNIPPPFVDPMSLPPPATNTFHPHATGSETYQFSQDYASLPYQNENMFSPTQDLSQIQGSYMSHSSPLNYNQPPPPIPEEGVNDFHPDPSGNDQSSVHSDHLDSSPHSSPTRQEPVSAFSPIQEPPQLRNNFKNYNAPSTYSRPPPPAIPEETANDLNPQPNSSSSRPNNVSSTNNDQTGLFSNWAGKLSSVLPKSKQMNLPDDSSKRIVYDDQRGTWVDTSKPEGEEDDDYNEPPPQFAPVKPPPTYSFAPKSTKTRYPKAQF